MQRSPNFVVIAEAAGGGIDPANGSIVDLLVTASASARNYTNRFPSSFLAVWRGLS